MICIVHIAELPCTIKRPLARQRSFLARMAENTNPLTGEHFTKPPFLVTIIPMLSAVSPSLAWAHPLVQEWFTARFSTPTEPQEQRWPHILAGHTTLISPPTGSGKTLPAFLPCTNRLVC